jgi:hypothetical protein
MQTAKLRSLNALGHFLWIVEILKETLMNANIREIL